MVPQEEWRTHANAWQDVNLLPCSSQVTFLAMYHLLAFGSGWDEDLMRRSRRDAAETIQFGLLGMAISGQRLDHHFMKVWGITWGNESSSSNTLASSNHHILRSSQAFSPLLVNNFFGIESHEDSPIEGMPGITMSKPGPLQVRSNCNSTCFNSIHQSPFCLLQPLVIALQKAVVETGEALGEDGSGSLGAFINGSVLGGASG